MPKEYKISKAKKRFYLTLPLIISLLLFFSCAANFNPRNADYVAEELGITISNAEEITNIENHGGFHGDGQTYIVLQFSDDSLIKQIEKSEEWLPFPMSDVASEIAYGKENGYASFFPRGDDDNSVLPKIQNGYYLLRDRQENVPEDILNRYSVNFTMAICDADTNLLYFLEMAT